VKPGVAVVIPAFNHAKHLGEAVDSVLAQDYPHVDLLVIDDGSTDDTPRVLERYGARVRWISRENRGQSATLNEGWARTKGDLLLYLGDDDVLLPGAIARAAAAMAEDAALIGVYGDYLMIDARSRTLRRVHMPDVDVRRMLRDFATPPAAGTFVSRRVWEVIGGWDESLRQVPDRDFYQRALLQGRMRRVDEPLAAFRVHAESQTFRPRDASRAAEPVLVVDRLFERDDLPADLKALKTRARAMARVVAARHDLRRQDWSGALRHLTDAVAVQPHIVLSPRAWRFVANGVNLPGRLRGAPIGSENGSGE
jgi:glycosyltransferase involved in cell wall biosynthesis